ATCFHRRAFTRRAFTAGLDYRAAASGIARRGARLGGDEGDRRRGEPSSEALQARVPDLAVAPRGGQQRPEELRQGRLIVEGRLRPSLSAAPDGRRRPGPARAGTLRGTEGGRRRRTP